MEQTPEALALFRERHFPIFDSPARAVSALRAIRHASTDLQYA
jgi:hypothetical protein